MGEDTAIIAAGQENSDELNDSELKSERKLFRAQVRERLNNSRDITDNELALIRLSALWLKMEIELSE